MNIGSLYQVKEYFWLLCPSQDLADTADDADADDAAYIEPNSIFVLLEQDKQCCKILTTNGELGWIVYPENEGWTKGSFEEVTV